MKTGVRLFQLIIAVAALTFFNSCGDDEPGATVDAPRAIFESSLATDNSGTVTFTNLSIGADSYAWDFGDGTGTSTEENPTYTYSETGKYTVTLTVTNAGGTDDSTAELSVAFNVIIGGDMSDESAWVFRQVWGDVPDNNVLHSFQNGAFFWDNADDNTGWSQSYLYQEVALEAGKTYKFDADVASTSGTKNVWFELFLGNVDPAEDGDYSSNGVRLYISSFDAPDSGCGANPFNGSFVAIGKQCNAVSDDPQKYRNIFSADGTFTLSAEEMTANGTIFLVFKSGSGFGADEDNRMNYMDGIILDNVSIVEVL